MTDPVPDGFELVPITFPPPAVMNARGYVDPSCATYAQYVTRPASQPCPACGHASCPRADPAMPGLALGACDACRMQVQIDHLTRNLHELRRTMADDGR